MSYDSDEEDYKEDLKRYAYAALDFVTIFFGRKDRILSGSFNPELDNDLLQSIMIKLNSRPSFL